MLEVYSLNVTVPVDTAVPLNNVSYRKGCATTIEGTSSIALNKCGIYKVDINASTAASATIQMYRNGVPQPQAQSTGLTPSFSTLVTVDENNNCCPCTAPTVIQFMNTGTAVATLTDFNVVVTKII